MYQSTETESLIGGRPPTPPPQAQPQPTTPQDDNQPQPAATGTPLPPLQVQSGYGSIETPNVTPYYSAYEDRRRNRPQSSSLGAASLIFVSNGMSLAMSIGMGPLIDYSEHVQYCWFTAVIIGSCLSAFLVNILPKRIFFLTASALVIVKGIIYIAFPTNTTWLILARYSDGLAFGLSLIPAILAGSEQSVRQIRGRVLSVEQSSLLIGALLMALFIHKSTDEQANRIHGIASLIYGLLALLFSFLTTIESPIFHLRKNNETEALNVQRQLQIPGTITNETYALLNESKTLLEEDLARGVVQNVSNSWIPLVKLTFLRVIVTLSFSLPLVWGYIFVLALKNLLQDTDPFWFVFLRLVGVTFSVMTIDRIGRKVVTTIGLVIGSIFLLAIGSLFSSSADVTVDNLNAIIAFSLIYQFLAGLVAPTSTCYLSEGFSLSVKPYFILISIVIENLAQIIICTESQIDSVSTYAFVLGAFQFIFGFVVYFTLPETKDKTLREALELFKKPIHVNLGNV